MKSFYEQLGDRSKKRFALLVDPDRYDDASLKVLIGHINRNPPDLLLVGGSIVFSPIDLTIIELKLRTKLPVFIFPGNVMQLSDRADGIFFLSLISGRNAEFLVGNHVLAAPHLDRSGIEVIPTGYLLIGNGQSTSVEYMSNTTPIPGNKPELGVATAMAGEMLGLKAIYLEAGSGATNAVEKKMISSIRKKLSLPLIVGGGIDTVQKAEVAYKAGADMIVVSSLLEKHPEKLEEFCTLRSQMNSSLVG